MYVDVTADPLHVGHQVLGVDLVGHRLVIFLEREYLGDFWKRHRRVFRTSYL